MFIKLRKKLADNKGFTLVEMLIAMAIFVTFTSVLINSYTSIVRAQRDANDYRIMYAEARRTFDTLTRELRDAMVDYGSYGGAGIIGAQDEIRLVTKDGRNVIEVRYEEPVESVENTEETTPGKVILAKGRVPAGVAIEPNYPVIFDERVLNSDEVNVKSFAIYVSPSIDPYDQEYVFNDVNQFHPKITIFAEFERELSNGNMVTMDLQTSVSSRIYNQVYPTE